MGRKRKKTNAELEASLIAKGLMRPKGVLSCPSCGNTTEFEYCEMIPRYAPVRIEGKEVVVEIDNDNAFWDGAEQAVFYCRKDDCNREIPADGITIHWNEVGG